MADIPFGNSARDTAVLLLDAAQKLGLDPSVVEARPFNGIFIVPDKVATKAFGEKEETDSVEAKKAPAKKAPAKKASAKKSAAKKAATNKKEGSK